MFPSDEKDFPLSELTLYPMITFNRFRTGMSHIHKNWHDWTLADATQLSYLPHHREYQRIACWNIYLVDVFLCVELETNSVETSQAYAVFIKLQTGPQQFSFADIKGWFIWHVRHHLKTWHQGRYASMHRLIKTGDKFFNIVGWTSMLRGKTHIYFISQHPLLWASNPLLISSSARLWVGRITG